MLQADRDPFVRIRRGPDGVGVDGTPCWQSWPGARDPPNLFARWEAAADELHIATDRYGMYPLYVWHDADQIACSPSITQLLDLGAPRRLDFASLAVGLRLGFFLGNDTPFTAIRALSAGETVLRLGSAPADRPPRLPHIATSTLSRDSAVDAYRDLFGDAIRAGLAGARKVAVPLSGGRDSRHILLELVRQGRAPDECLTALYYPPRPNIDLPVARRLAARLGVPHRVVPQGPSQLATLRRHFADTGLCTLTPSSFVQPVAEQCVRSGIDTVFDGLAGDTLSAGHFLTPQIVRLFAESRFDELADALLSRFHGMEEALIERVLPRAAVAELSRAVALERVARELVRHAGAPNPAASFVFFHRTRRDIALLPTRVYRTIPNVVCPYLHPELFDLLYSLPPAYVVDHEFHDDTIRRAYPHMADVPYAQRAPAKIDRRQQYGFALEIAGMLRTPGSMELLDGSYVWPRILRALVDPTYLPAISTLGPRIVYLAELGLSAPGHSAVRAARRARRPARTAAR